MRSIRKQSQATILWVFLLLWLLLSGLLGSSIILASGVRADNAVILLAGSFLASTLLTFLNGLLYLTPGGSFLPPYRNDRNLLLTHWAWIVLAGLWWVLIATSPLAIPVRIAVLVCVLSGAACGAMLAGYRRYGLVEDNQIPDADTESAVRAAHARWCAGSAPMTTGKRLFDILLSAVGMLLALPFGCLAVLLIWLEDPGPALFVKNSVGRGGKNFRQYKIRTMVRDAEQTTGPVMASRDDRRILLTGRILRKTALDELPQLWNILLGEMSFVGPRPQRTVLVKEYLRAIPEYAERHRVVPGLAGLAQVAGHYFLTPRQKLRYDRLYARHATLRFDLLLLFLAFGIVFWWRWQPGWNGRIPRRWLHHR